MLDQSSKYLEMEVRCFLHHPGVEAVHEAPCFRKGAFEPTSMHYADAGLSDFLLCHLPRKNARALWWKPEWQRA
jgi:hypothetical protein